MGEQFAASYLPFAYGQASARTVRGVTPALRRALNSEPSQVPPEERRRRPRVDSIQVVGMTPTFALATAEVSDGGIIGYRLRFTLTRTAEGWAVNGVEAG